MKIYRSYSSVTTQRLGEKLAKKIVKRTGGRKAIILGLEGELGSGKTTFAQGFLKGLGLKKRVTSPTFVIVRRSPLTKGNFLNFFHIDAYRLKRSRELASLGFKKIVADPQNITLIEWADRIKPLLPKSVTKIHFRYGRKKSERIIFY